MATQWYQAVHTSKPRFRVGTRKRSIEGCEFVYGTGVSSNAVGAFVVFNDQTYTPVLLVNTPLTGEVGISMSTNASSVTNQLSPATTVNWSWYMVYGSSKQIPNLKGLVSIASGSTDKGALYQSGTGGQATTSAAATKVIFGAWAQGVSASNLGDALLNYPSTVGSSTL